MAKSIFIRPAIEYSRIALESESWSATEINREYRRLYGILRKRYQRMIKSKYSSSRIRTKMATLLQFSPSSFGKTKEDIKNPQKISALAELANVLNRKTSSITGMKEDISNKVSTLRKNHPNMDYITEENFLDYVDIVQGFMENHEKNFKYDVLEEDLDLLDVVGRDSGRFIGEHLDEFRVLINAKNELQLAVSKYNKENAYSNTEAIIFYNDELTEFYNYEFSGFTKHSVEEMSNIKAEDIANYFIEKHNWPEDILRYI